MSAGQGGYVAGEWRWGPAKLDAAGRYENREARADSEARSAGQASLAGGVEFSLPASFRFRAVLSGEIVGDGGAEPGGEARLLWDGGVPVYASVARAARRPTARQWASGLDFDGTIVQGELGAAAPSVPGSPSVRVYRRRGDGIRYLYSVNAFIEDSRIIDERTHGVEFNLRAGRWGLDYEVAYLWNRSRDAGSSELLPYQSDHIVRGRVSWRHFVPYIRSPGRFDLLGEWRSDRFAPGRDYPMEPWYYSRGRWTVTISGADLYGQVEQIFGHQLEYIAGPTEGSPGILSGSFGIYLGIVVPLED